MKFKKFNSQSGFIKCVSHIMIQKQNLKFYGNANL